MMKSKWITANELSLLTFLPAFRHRLSNLSTPVSLLFDESFADPVYDSDLVKSLSISAMGLSRLCSLISVISGSATTPLSTPSSVSIRYDFKESLYNDYLFVFNELSQNAEDAGASNILFYLENGYIYSKDDAPVINDLSWLGGVSYLGKSGCGLGLTACAAYLRNKETVLEGQEFSSTKFRFAI